jgi:uncharacterized membrane protein
MDFGYETNYVHFYRSWMTFPMEISSSSSSSRFSINVGRLLIWLSRNWIAPFAILMGLYVGLPFLAPIFMYLGYSGPGRWIYAIYSTQCHQLPDRSFFLFGQQVMYSLATIQAAWKETLDPAVLRQFIGSPFFGWKVAWSDRMVSMYTCTLIFGLLWWPLRRRIKPLPWWGLILFLTPMGIDGLTHMISDLMYGIGAGFRYDNTWLAALTHHAFSTSFYDGNALGSFNSWMRLLSGVFFGIGLVWFGFPFLEDAFHQFAASLETRLRKD